MLNFYRWSNAAKWVAVTRGTETADVVLITAKN